MIREIARRQTVLIGLIGEGIGPSLTPPMHELEGARHGLSYIYRTIELAPGEGDAGTLANLLSAARRLGFTGLNITHPVKQAVLPLLDDLAESARTVGAVNTVVFTPEGAVGHNTDTTGFGAAFQERFSDVPHRRVALVGAGGAGSAVAHALARHGVEELVVLDVDTARARELAGAVAARAPIAASGGDVAELPGLAASFDGFVNATPFGMAAHPGTAFDVDLLDPRQFVADIVYRPVETALLAAARARGCRVMTGLAMAMHQAADAFEIFTGRQADRQAMLADLDALVRAETTGPAAEGDA